jgi:hypothetical protein
VRNDKKDRIGLFSYTGRTRDWVARPVIIAESPVDASPSAKQPVNQLTRSHDRQEPPAFLPVSVWNFGCLDVNVIQTLSVKES